MIVKLFGSCLIGLDAHLIEIEIGTTKGLPQETIIGLADHVIRESKSRIRSAISQSQFHYPLLHYTINLAPAQIKKNGSLLDLPMALGILAATKQYSIPKNTIFLGELSLNGVLKPIPCAFPICFSLLEQFPNFRIILPVDNKQDVMLLNKKPFVFYKKLSDVVEGKQTREKIFISKKAKVSNITYPDFSKLIGLNTIKTAIVLALIGKQNVLLIGPPGCGKSQLLKCLPSIGQKLSLKEKIESLRIRGLLNTDPSHVNDIPIQSPHHTISYAGMFGGGTPIKPGAISLAHNGILILDELPEFKRDILEGLRQPMEDKHIQLSRLKQHITLPANCQIFATMNPCPCGYFGSQQNECHCTERQIHSYHNRISGPILDRFGIILQVPKIDINHLFKRKQSKELDSSTLKNWVRKSIRNKHATETEEVDIFNNKETINEIVKKHKLSYRALKHIITIARSLSILEESKTLNKCHILAALQYRKTNWKTSLL